MSNEPRTWSGDLHPDLLAAKARVYDPAGLACSPPVAEAESAQYAAYGFDLDGRAVRFRAARTTPAKAGQFVTVWKRPDPRGPIRPFDTADDLDLVVISSRDGGRFGQFVLPCAALGERDVLSRDGVGGKRAFRVYPPWVTTTNRQARAAQAWQLEFFLPVPEGGPVDLVRARALYRARD